MANRSSGFGFRVFIIILLLAPRVRTREQGYHDLDGTGTCLGCYTLYGSYGFNIIQIGVVRGGFTTDAALLFSGSYPGGRVEAVCYRKQLPKRCRFGTGVVPKSKNGHRFCGV